MQSDAALKQTTRENGNTRNISECARYTKSLRLFSRNAHQTRGTEPASKTGSISNRLAGLMAAVHRCISTCSRDVDLGRLLASFVFFFRVANIKDISPVNERFGGTSSAGGEQSIIYVTKLATAL